MLAFLPVCLFRVGLSVGNRAGASGHLSGPTGQSGPTDQLRQTHSSSSVSAYPSAWSGREMQDGSPGCLQRKLPGRCVFRFAFCAELKTGREMLKTEPDIWYFSSLRGKKWPRGIKT